MKFKFTEEERARVVHALSGETSLQKSIDRIEAIVSERSETPKSGARSAEDVLNTAEWIDECKVYSKMYENAKSELDKLNDSLTVAIRRIAELEAVLFESRKNPGYLIELTKAKE